jgi:tetratricopeptide (TPR) repeat protein
LLAAVAVAVNLFLASLRAKEANANALLQQARGIYEAPVHPPGQEPPNKPGELVSFPTVEAKCNETLKLLDEYIAKYSGAKDMKLAKLMRAQSLWQLDRKDDAKKEYEEVSRGYSGELAGALADFALVRIKEDAGNLDGAIADYEKLMNVPLPDFPRDDVLSSLAKCYELKNQPDEALKTYQRLVDEYPMSVFAYQAKGKLIELRPLVMQKMGEIKEGTKPGEKAAQPAPGTQTGTPAKEKAAEPGTPGTENQSQEPD